LSKSINNILIPNVTKIPSNKNVDASNKLSPGSAKKSEFNELLEAKKNESLHGGINLSSHAAKRLQERQIDFNGTEYVKVKDAMAKLKSKGAKDSLIITDKAAYVVDVKNNKVVTAVDKMSMNDNVFTKIDSTVFVN
jgi:flagellar operon protein